MKFFCHKKTNNKQEWSYTRRFEFYYSSCGCGCGPVAVQSREVSGKECRLDSTSLSLIHLLPCSQPCISLTARFSLYLYLIFLFFGSQFLRARLVYREFKSRGGWREKKKKINVHM